MQSERFVIFSQARSGSTWLVNTINNIEGVTCYGELFLSKAIMFEDGDIQVPRFLLWKQSHLGIRPFSTFRYFREVFPGTGVQGFKLMYAQLARFPEIVPYMLSRRMKVIHLVRKNTLDSILSAMVAQERGRFHFRGDDVIPEEQPLHVEPDQLVKRIATAEQNTDVARRLLRLSGLQWIEVYYEDLLADTQNFKTVWDFLGIDFSENQPTWQIKKSRKKNRRESIANYQEVEFALNKAGYSHYLDNAQAVNS